MSPEQSSELRLEQARHERKQSMRTNTMTVFAEYVAGTGSVYTSEEWNDALGLPNKLAIQAVSDQVSGTPTISISVAIEHSCDQRNWSAKATTPEIDAKTITAGTTTTWFGSDSGATPSLSYVRLKITLAGGTPAAHVKIHVCGRDET